MATTTLERKPEAPSPSEANQPAANGTRRKIALRPEEGWTTFFLLALVLYSAVWSIQVVGWVAGLGVLTWTTGAGLVLGLIAAKQQRVPRLAIHALMMALGILFAFWGTANAAFSNNVGALWTHFIAWLQKATTPNTNTNDDVMFLLFLAVLSFILAYVSIWLVVRTRRPWLVALATAIVLLINLSYSPDGNVVYLIIFLLATLLLLVRFNLVEAYRQWRRRSLRHTPDLGWDFMMAGMLFSVGILILSWLLPTAGTNEAIANAWNNASNPWVAAQQLWSNLFQVSGGGGSSAYFSNSLQLTGNVDLPNQVILTYTSQQPDQYLVAVTQDFFDGHINWTQTNPRKSQVDANAKMPAETQVNHLVQQNIRLVNPPAGSPSQYLFAADQPASFSLPSTITRDQNGGYTAWYARQALVKGEQYTATSYVSSASEEDLRQVPFPVLSDGTNPLYFFPPAILSRYLQVPNDLKNDREVQQMLHDWTDTYTTMYDKALALENQLRSRYTYSQHNDDPPANQDAVAWFLKTEKKGFCTFFASAMVMLARMLGMPARLASGYTNGTFDQNTKLWTVKGTDAHTWAQIYFAGYGWINFEPSAGFATFIRPVGSQTPSTSETPDTGTTPQASKTPRDVPNPQTTGPNSTTPNQQNETTVRLLLGAGSLLALLLLVLGATSFWWRRLFRGLSPVAQTFGRVTLLASWAGFKPKRTQTPFEYIEELQQRLPAQAEPLQRLGELYVHERWSPPAEGGGLRDELLRLWMSLRGGLVRAVVRRPPLNPLTWVRRLGQRRRGRRR